MRKWWLIIIMCFFLCEVNAGRKALLVGISKYPQNSGWREISSSNDLELLASILKGHASVTILSGERASKAGIIMALKKLRGEAQNGDTILIHLSGHGQQMWSDDRKAITYTTPDGKKCRDFKLHETKYLKGNMEFEFRIRKEIAAGLEGSGAAADVNGGKGRALRHSDGEQLEGFGSRTAYADRNAQEHSGRAWAISHRGRTGQPHERPDDASGAVQQGVGEGYERLSAGDERRFNKSPEVSEESGSGFGTVDEYGGEGYRLTGWENERGIFEAFILGEGISYYSDETPDVNFTDAGSHTDDYDAALGYLVADLTDIIDEDRPIQDCTTIHYPKERKKHQQGGGPMMGGM